MKCHFLPYLLYSTLDTELASIRVVLQTRNTFHLQSLPVIESVWPPETTCRTFFSAVTWPIRIGVSPRAWMMKGEATWKAPSAAAPWIRVRRLNFGLKVCEVMNSPGESLIFFLGKFLGMAGRLARCSTRRQVVSN